MCIVGNARRRRQWKPGSGTPCNNIPQSLINPIGQKLINLYPLPNANNAALGYNYVSEPVRKLNEGKFDIRVDENLSTKDTLFARFSYDQAESYVPGGAPGFAEQGAFASNQSIRIMPAMRPSPRRTFFRRTP